jgi:hypothetical protein
MSQIQTYLPFNVRAAAILTNAYVAGTIIGLPANFPDSGVHLNNQLGLYIFFTIGSLTDLLIKIEFSNDPAFAAGNTVQETSSVISAGISTDTNIVHKYTGSGNYRILMPIKDRYIRVSAEGEGTVTSSSLTITAIIGID